MELADLQHDERLALIALVKSVVAANARATAEESAAVRSIAAAFGPATYRALADESAERIADEESLRAALKGVARQDARDLIYGTALEAATADVPDDDESSFLGWLRRTWRIRVEIEPPPTT
jgi:hypothetical protein